MSKFSLAAMMQALSGSAPSAPPVVDISATALATHLASLSADDRAALEAQLAPLLAQGQPPAQPPPSAAAATTLQLLAGQVTEDEAARREAAAAKAERDRWAAVLGHDKAKGKQAAARFMLANSDAGADAIVAQLDAAPADAGTPQARLATVPNPTIVAGRPGGSAADNPVRAAIEQQTKGARR